MSDPLNDNAQDNYKGVWDSRIGFGEKSALVVVDFMQGYTTPEAPLYAPGVVEAIPHAAEVLDRARRAGLPIIHTNIRYQPERFLDGGVWLKKAPVMKAMVEGNPHAAFCPEVAPRPEELVISKQYPSSFFGTSLAPTLRALGVDTVVLMGCSTSGCIRATAVDGLQHGFRVMVIRECVGDRHPDPHEANLFDIDSKYGDVIAKEELLAHIDA
ncbi:N-carbamoylsarcosine amidohydrolase [Halomonas sp. MES3-P3E]|uniref:N-carbamoylsarcosine amidohydrolase n=1 Tax=Halomonas sp. MES3-P3E TaxID=2058321 RepID=UPI000C330419|nr:N-carbamoylsarcosine amidohydrolase [Halomonas sp. MES3-P3E]PKG54226.1 isochorismatase [Halomonas sp. MES3-P3E]|tara:strand:- start:831 stop:1469 length:639 start_codon:yes stop_codon:yes gene_type:complete